MTKKIETTLAKRKSSAFGKDVYLLGKNEYGELLWLEAPKWDCGWYWGFGYVEVFTNQKYPDRARDISSHAHFDGLVGFPVEGKYIHHLNESPKMQETVLTDAESWRLSDLMKQFYTLKDAAAVLGCGGANLANPCIAPCPDLAKAINEEYLPQVFVKVLEILAPAA